MEIKELFNEYRVSVWKSENVKMDDDGHGCIIM